MNRENIAHHQIRLNLDDERHLRVNNDIDSINPKLWKSKNQYIIDALDYYGKNFGSVEQQEKEQQERELKFRKEVVDDISVIIHKEIASLIGTMLKTVFIGGGASTADTEERVRKQEPADEYEQKAIDLIDKWNDWEDTDDKSD